MGQAHKQSFSKAAVAAPSSSAKKYFVLSLSFIAGILVGSQALKNFKIDIPGTTLFAPAAVPEASPAATTDVVPEWRTRKYYTDDLEAWFGIRVIHQLQVPDFMQKYVDAHDVTTDAQYLADKELFDNYARVFGPLLDKRTNDPDRRIYVRWTGDDKKFGVFTDQYIPPYAFITEYAGILVNNSRSTDYEWHYYSRIKDEDGNVMALGVDSQFVGNIGRFVNHEDQPNCDVVYVPWRNRWRPIYVAVKPIYPGQELTVSYGANYWESRDKLKVSNTAPTDA